MVVFDSVGAVGVSGAVCLVGVAGMFVGVGGVAGVAVVASVDGIYDGVRMHVVVLGYWCRGC